MLGIVVLVHVQSFPRIPGQNVGPGLFPGLVAGGLVVCALVLIFNGLRHRAAHPWVETGAWMRSWRHVMAFVVTIAGTAAYVAFANTIGYPIIGPLFLLALFLAYGVRPVQAIVIAIVVALVIHIAFYKLLRVPLPWGVLTPFAF
jgi:putative tricarboxylic transport membrane protein